MANLADNFLGGIKAGVEIRDSYDRLKTRKATQKFFETLKAKTALEDEEEAAPDAPAAALPVAGNEPIEGMAAATAAMAGQQDVAAIPDAAPAKPKKAPRSLQYKDIEELDTLAAAAAAAGGDAKVYDALKSVATTRMQGAMLREFSGAHAALQSGNEEAALKALRRANYFLPDGQDLEFKKVDGKTMVKNPLTGEMDELNAQTLDTYRRAAMDPQQFGEFLWTRKDADRKAKVDQQQADATTKNASTNAVNAATQAAQQAETARANREKEGIERRQVAVQERQVASQNLARDAGAVRDLAYADYLRGGKDGSGKGLTPEQVRQYQNDVGDATRAALFPEQLREVDDGLGGKTFVKGPGTPLPGFENATAGDLTRVSGIAEALGAANQQAGINSAVQWAAELDRRVRTGGTIKINSQSGVIGIPMPNGEVITFRAPPQLIQQLKASQPAAPVQGVPVR